MGKVEVVMVMMMVEMKMMSSSAASSHSVSRSTGCHLQRLPGLRSGREDVLGLVWPAGVLIVRRAECRELTEIGSSDGLLGDQSGRGASGLPGPARQQVVQARQ